MSISSHQIEQSNPVITCCVCLDTTPSNTNFRSWSCSGVHPEIICNKCHSHMMDQGDNCPLCRATPVQRINNNISNIIYFYNDSNIIENIYYNTPMTQSRRVHI